MKVVSTSEIKQTVQVLKKGMVVAYPTDTAYGLGASVDSLKGIKKIFKIKGRQGKNPISIVVSSLAQAKKVAVFNKNALRLWKKFMPGALTLVLPISNVLRGRKKGRKKERKNWKLLSAGT